MNLSGPPLWAVPLLMLGLVVFGAYAAGVIDAAVAAGIERRWRPRSWSVPIGRLGAMLQQRPVRTEHPDRVLEVLAPAAYAALVGAGLCVIPLGRDWAVADLTGGLVLWGAVEALLVIVVFLQGWAPNSPLALVSAYRYVAIGLSYILLSMFVLIAVALPAESLQLSRIVESQSDLWNVVRQPLGLPLFGVVALGATFWGPLDLAAGRDVAGGTTVEAAGATRAAWLTARAAGLTAFSAMAATAFLGGWHGPLLPGPLWVAVKTLLVLAVLVTVGRIWARVPAERFVTVAWTVLLPLAFVDLVIGALGAL